MSTDVTVDMTGLEDFVLNFYNGVGNDATEEMLQEWRTDPDVPVDTREMVDTMFVEHTVDDWPVLEWVIHAPAEHSSYQEEGTGIYGPEGVEIVPTNSPVLVYYWKKTGRVHFSRSVRGAPATHWFSKVRDRWPEFVERIAR